MNYKIVLVLFALLLGITCTANAIPVLHILDVQSTTEARVLVVDRTTGEETSYSDPSNLVLYYQDFSQTLSPWLAAHAQPLFGNGHFSSSHNQYSQGGGFDCPYGGRVNVSSELNLRFTVEGSGATLGAEAVLWDTPGELQLTLVDETEGTSLFFGSGGWGQFAFSTGDLSFVDGHTYQLYARSEIENIGEDGSASFYWCCNSSFNTCFLRVPSGSTALLASSGLFLLFGYIRLSKQHHKDK